MRCSILGYKKELSKLNLAFHFLRLMRSSRVVCGRVQESGGRQEEEDHVERFEHEVGMVCGGMVS